MATKPTINPDKIGAGLGELKARLLFLVFALFVYRVGTHIPVPGIDPNQLTNLFNQNEGTFLGLFNMFSGGALERMSIVALGIMPYISASIIMQLLTAVSPQLEQLKKEGESGRRKITQYTRYGSLVLATVQGTGMTVGLLSPMAYNPGMGFTLTAIVSLVTGAMFMMWLGEQITERWCWQWYFHAHLRRHCSGSAGSHRQFIDTGLRRSDQRVAAVRGGVDCGGGYCCDCFHRARTAYDITVELCEEAAKGDVMYAAQTSHLPLKVNMAGVIPVDFRQQYFVVPGVARAVVRPVRRC